LYQIRWHGRGGQGSVTAAKVFGLAVAVYENNYAQSFPAFGVERRGAPVLAFTKIDSAPILDRSQIYTPDFVTVLDAGLLQTVDVTSGLKPGGKLIINAAQVPAKLKAQTNYEVIAVNATKIAFEVLGRPIMNTAMVGALCAVSGLVKFSSVEKALADVFPERLAGKNIKAAQLAYEEVMSKQEGELR